MKFDSSYFGPQGETPEDKIYGGSTYSEIRDACFQNAYYLNWGAEGESPLPVYGVTLGRILKGFYRGWRKWLFVRAAERAVDSSQDLRWGFDRRGYRRLLHPNGVCLFGKWIIDQETPYSGYFGTGKEALIIGRYSVCCSETRRGFLRSQALVGKLFPTTDENHEQPLKTANFITQEDLGGSRFEFMNDVSLRNAPDVTPLARGFGLPILLITGLVFRIVDFEPIVRQLYPIAELGLQKGEHTRSPQFMQLKLAEDQQRIPGDQLDFRDEALSHIYDHGDSRPLRKLVFDIEVSDSSKSFGILKKRRTFDSWKKIGRIEFSSAVASYNGDFVLHFLHPPWRLDPDDPNTVLRK